MPTYEYLCRACGHGFDIVQAFADDTLTICPACGGELRKIFAAPTITFKGSGFYATDNRKGTKGEGESRSDGSKESKESKESKDGVGSKGSKDATSSGTSDSKGSEKKADTTTAPKKGSPSS
jgi:putative FmdB family regulatory protein